MKLTYRGHTYDPNASSVQIDRQPLKLMYRGQSFEYNPKPVPLSCALPQDNQKPMKLIYRGQTFDHLPPAPQPYRKPRAMNWRFTMVAEYAATLA